MNPRVRFVVIYRNWQWCPWCGHLLLEHGAHPEGLHPEPGLVWTVCNKCPQSVCVHEILPEA